MRARTTPEVPCVDRSQPADHPAVESRGPVDPQGPGAVLAHPPAEGIGLTEGHGVSTGQAPRGQGLMNAVRPERPPGLRARVDLINGHSASAQMARIGTEPGSGRSSRRRRAALRALQERAAMHVPDGTDP
jgi:hypothetical protein